MNPLRILLLCHSFNSLTQRLFAELRAAGHTLSVELDIADSVTEEAVALFRPDLVLAPFLKRRIPATVWQRVTCLVVHPGPPGDQGPSALDWAVWRREPHWGVTVLQANGDFDAGPVWAHASFDMRPATKGSLYRREVTQAALQAALAAVQRFAGGEREGPGRAGEAPLVRWQPLLRQSERAIHWATDSTATVLAKLRSGDGQPGVLDALWGQPCYLGDAHPASATTVAEFSDAESGALLAVRDGALLRRTVDGGVWIGQARRADPPGTPPAPRPCTISVSSSSSMVTPLASSPRAMASMRSDSLTRNSLTPRITVLPLAKAATKFAPLSISALSGTMPSVHMVL